MADRIRCGLGEIRRSAGARLFAILAAALLAQACTSVNSYVPPEGDPSTLATVRGYSVNNGLFDWENYMFGAIDSKSVSYFFRSGPSSKITVSAADHRFTVFSKFNRGFFDACPCEAFVDIFATLEAGVEYQLKGQVEGAGINVWLEKIETEERVSEIRTARYRVSPRESYIYIPIVTN